MKSLLYFLNVLLIISTGYTPTAAQDPAVLIDPALDSTQNQFLNSQAEALLDQARTVLSENSPDWPEPPARKSALLLLDGILHDVYAPQRLPVQNFFKSQLQKAIAQIEQTKISAGARIWKLYNHGFVVRTGTVTIGFDLISGISVGAEGFFMDSNHMERLITQCDVLFISHRHQDHAEEPVVQVFIDQGKPVVTPPGVWEDRPVYAGITHLPRKAHQVQTLSVQNGRQKLGVVVYPGHQGEEIDNNVVLVFTPEDLSFAQTGDQYNEDDFTWIDEIHKHHEVDVLLPNCWTRDIVRVAAGFNPALILTGHENEMGHTIDHREPYWLTYQRRSGSDRFGGHHDVGYDTPLILMTWGESYHYNKENFLR